MILIILIHQRYRPTDGRTDDMQSQYRALHYSASHGKHVSKRPGAYIPSVETRTAGWLIN